MVLSHYPAILAAGFKIRVNALVTKSRFKTRVEGSDQLCLTWDDGKDFDCLAAFVANRGRILRKLAKVASGNEQGDSDQYAQSSPAPLRLLILGHTRI